MTGINYNVGFSESGRLVRDRKPFIMSHPRAIINERAYRLGYAKKSGTAEITENDCFRLFCDFS